MKKKIKPPAIFKWLLVRTSSREEEFTISGDFEEIFQRKCRDKGYFKALCWYVAEVFKTIPVQIINSVIWSYNMFTNYYKIALRNIMRYKGYSFINIARLAVRLACAVLIFLWINFETGYDRFHENRDELFQIVNEQDLPGGMVRFHNTPGALAQALKNERPEIENVSRAVERAEIMLGTMNNRFLEKVRFVDPAFLNMFSMEFIQGNPGTALSQPNSIILTENVAGKHFGETGAIGREIILESDKSLLVTAVIRELPENSFLNSSCLVPVTVLGDMGWNIDNWSSGNFYTYVHLKEEADTEVFNREIRGFYKKYAPNWENSKLTIKPITKIHLYDLNGGGPIVYVYIFSLLTVFVLLLAIVNFTNLSTARSVLRAKEIGVRKVAGANKRQLTKQILMESILVTFFSGALAVVIAYFLLPVLNKVTGAPIKFSFDIKIILFLFLTVILTGITAGIYPAFILSSLRPVRAIKGGINPGKDSLFFRKALITFQFSLSIFMIIAMTGVNKQLKYLNTMDLGYNRDNIISMGLTQDVNRQFTTVQTELLRHPEIFSVTRSSSKMNRKNTTTGGDAVSWEGQSDGMGMPRVHLMRSDPEFVETFNIDMTEGRFFSREFPNDRIESAVINETALKAMDIESPIGKRVTIWNRNFTIIGVIKDFHFYSLHQEIQPLIFVNRYAGLQTVFIRINSQNLSETISYIRNKVKEFVPGYVPELKFLDEELNNSYITEQRMAKATGYFTFLAVFISCIGLLGLVSFSARQKTKEIAIRKVLGASEGTIIFQLYKEILICVSAAAIITCPAAYFVLRGWLQNYAYHTTMGIGVFIFASVLSLAIAFLSVGLNVIKASLANPVESLRFE